MSETKVSAGLYLVHDQKLGIESSSPVWTEQMILPGNESLITMSNWYAL